MRGDDVQPSDIEVLSNKDIPEAVRSQIAEQILGSGDREAQRDIEKQKLESERRKFIWNTPVVAALAGLLTLSATFIFDRLTAKDETANTITLEQVRTELQQSEVRLKQELELDTSESLAKLEAEAKEREFQYEIVRSELTNAEKSNAERAAVLLFLVRAGVLSSLNEDELRKMAEEQIERPDAAIIPRLTSSPQYLGGIVGPDDSSRVSEFEAEHPVRKLALSVGRLKIMNANQTFSTCTAFLIALDKIATARHCVELGYERMRFELFPTGSVQNTTIDDFVVINVADEAPELIHTEADNEGGYATLKLETPVDDIFQPLRLESATGVTNARLGVIYFRNGDILSAVWGADDCRALKWERNVVYHLCDTGRGTSGSPVFDLESKAVVAVHSRRSEFGGVAYRILR